VGGLSNWGKVEGGGKGVGVVGWYVKLRGPNRLVFKKKKRTSGGRRKKPLNEKGDNSEEGGKGASGKASVSFCKNSVSFCGSVLFL